MKERFIKGNKCILLTKNAYGTPVLCDEAVVEKVGNKYLSVRKDKVILRFDYERTVYNGLECIEDFYRSLYVFVNKEEMKQHVVREKYLTELQKLFNNPQSVSLSLEELKYIYDLLKKEKNNGTK